MTWWKLAFEQCIARPKAPPVCIVCYTPLINKPINTKFCSKKCKNTDDRGTSN